jgi:periplasmic divalent cation tolerance protein
MSDVRVVLMTAPDRPVAEKLAQSLVRERLAACANVVPGLTSFFWWDDDVQRADETLVIMKTPADRVDALMTRAAELHPYDVPELISLPVEAGLEAYVAWVGRETRVGEPG